MAASSILVYLLTLLLAISPVNGEATLSSHSSSEIILRDVVVTLNGESYELGVDGRLAMVEDDAGSNMEFALQSGDDTLFPGRCSYDGEDFAFMMDGMSKSIRFSLSEFMGMTGDESLNGFMDAYREVQESYQELIRLALEKGDEGLAAEYADLDALIDRGEAVDSELEFDDGATFATQCRTYSLTKNDIADLMDAVLNGDGEFSVNLRRYMDAVTALVESSMIAEDDGDSPMPEGGFVQMFRDEESLDISVDVTEHVNEAEALVYDEVLLHITMDGEAVEIPLYLMTWGDTKTVDTYIDLPNVSFGLSAEQTENEEGTRMMADFSVQQIEVGRAHV